MGRIRDNMQRNLAYFLTLNEMSQKDLADRLNVSQSAVTNWIKGKNSPDIEVVAEICSILNVSVIDMLGTDDSRNGFSPLEEKHIKKYRTLDEYGKDMVDTVLGKEYTRCQAQAELAEEIASYGPGGKSLALYDLPVSAGPGMLLHDDQFEFITIPPSQLSTKADFALRVSGDSMEPKFYDGDIILVQSTPALEPGEIGIFAHNDAGYVKRYGGNGHLISLNPNYSDITISDEDSFKILGRVLGKAER